LALSFELGGAEKLLVEFARHADRRRFDLQFVALASDGIIGQQLRAAGCAARALNAADGLRPELVVVLARLFRQHRFDIVHTHLDRPHIYGTVAARLAGIPCVVHTRHGQSDDLTARQRRLVELLARMTDRFVCVSRDAARLTARSRGIPAARVCTIWNGIDLTQFSTTAAPANGPVVTVARLIPTKGLDVLLRAVALAAAQDRTLQLEIAGDGPLGDSLRSLTTELGISERVRFLGAVGSTAQLLGRAGMFVLASRGEGISLALLEAQARGVPVVATHVGGNPEVIAHGETGLLVPPDDPPALARAILRLRADAVLAARLGAAGRRRVETDFDVRAMVGRYQDLYDALLRRKAS
jgi:glycosyltransferase involved in cell wall biosynthesis